MIYGILISIIYILLFLIFFVVIMMIWVVGKSGCHDRSFSGILGRGYFCPLTILMTNQDQWLVIFETLTLIVSFFADKLLTVNLREIMLRTRVLRP